MCSVSAKFCRLTSIFLQRHYFQFWVFSPRIFIIREFLNFIALYLPLTELYSLSIPIPFSLRAARIGILVKLTSVPLVPPQCFGKTWNTEQSPPNRKSRSLPRSIDVLSTPSAVERVLVLPISTTVYYNLCRPVEKRSYYATKVFSEDFYCELFLTHFIYLFYS